MRKLARVVFQSLIGACAGATAGVIMVGLFGALTGIPFILAHSGPKNDPVSMFLGGGIAFGVYVGLPLGAPVGALIGLVVGAVRGFRADTSRVRKSPAPIEDFTDARGVENAALSSSSRNARRSLRLRFGLILAIPGAFIVVWLINGWREAPKFERFSAEVARLGGSVENAELEGWDNVVKYTNVDLSSTPTDDDDLKQLVRNEMFEGVHSLSLAGTRITDAGLAELDGHPWFSILNLSHTSVTDAGLAAMPRCVANTLNLSGTRVTDVTLDVIEKQAELAPSRSIDVTDTQVTEARVRKLGKSQSGLNITYGDSRSPKHTR